jgi:hypothetical protein
VKRDEYVYSIGFTYPKAGILAFNLAALIREIIAAARGAEADVPKSETVLPPITTW